MGVHREKNKENKKNLITGVLYSCEHSENDPFFLTMLFLLWTAKLKIFIIIQFGTLRIISILKGWTLKQSTVIVFMQISRAICTLSVRRNLSLLQSDIH